MDRFKGFLSGYMGRMENQMDKNVEHEMETGIVLGFPGFTTRLLSILGLRRDH